MTHSPPCLQKIVDSNADLEVKKSEAAQQQQNAAIATDVAVRHQQARTLSQASMFTHVLRLCARLQ